MPLQSLLESSIAVNGNRESGSGGALGENVMTPLNSLQFPTFFYSTSDKTLFPLRISNGYLHDCIFLADIEIADIH